MFATLLGALPRPPVAADASLDTLIEAVVRAQEAAGLEPVTDGGLGPADDPVAAWRATTRLTERAVKQALTGPYSAGSVGEWAAARRSADTLARATALNAVLRALAAAGCPLIEIHEPAAVTIGTDPAERTLFRAAHERLLDGVTGSHLSLALTGGSADAAGVETLLSAPYDSLAVDLIDGPDNWRLVTTTPGDRGIVCGAVSAAADSYDGPEPLLWAAGYAASSRGRGPARVGLATAGSLAALSWELATAKMARLGEAGRLATAPIDERLAALDPRAVSSRSAALGRRAPTHPDRDPGDVAG